jgi:curved DNA-binding protein CbpA
MDPESVRRSSEFKRLKAQLEADIEQARETAADEDAVRKALKKLVKKWHPDKHDKDQLLLYSELFKILERYTQNTHTHTHTHTHTAH